jgi:FlaA1/EpsC-like NDP-sugar epimerase
MMRNRYLVFADALLLVLAAFGAFVLRLDWFFGEYEGAFKFYLGAALVVKLPMFFLFGLYGKYWRYASVRDLFTVAFGVTAGAVLLSAVVLASTWLGYAPTPRVPRSILFIDWFLTLFLVSGVRLSVRVLGEATERQPALPRSARRSVLVVGAGDAGALVVRELQKNGQLGMVPVAFLDDDPIKRGKRILDVPVLGTLSELAAVVSRTGSQEVVIALPRTGGSVVRRVVEDCRRVGVPALALPGIYELLDGKVSINRLRSVEISDLLRRAPVVSPPDAAAYVRGRVVLITGAGGSIGSELCRQVAGAGAEALVLLGHGENSIYDTEERLRREFPALRLLPAIVDIRDRTRLSAVFERHRPAVVFHAAAHKHVPLMESNPEEAVTNNVLGSRNVVEAAVVAGVQRFVLISTDKAVEPSSIMGASKRVAETIVQRAAERSGKALVAVRFGNVLGSRGSVVPYFKAQIERGGPVTVTHPEMSRFFMTIPEAVHLVLEAGGKGVGGELYVLNMGEPVRIIDLARDLIGLSGLSPDEIPIVFTGLRPGEKLEEQLWDTDAHVAPTDNPEILRVSEPVRFAGDLLAYIDELSRAAYSGDTATIRRLLLGGQRVTAV